MGKGKGYGCDCAFGWKGVDERKREGGNMVRWVGGERGESFV